MVSLRRAIADVHFLLAASLLLGGLGSGCADPSPARPRGGAWYGDGNPPPKPEPKKKLGRWKPATTLDALLMERDAAPTEHLGGGFSAEIRVNPAAQGYAQPGRKRPLPQGALIVEVIRAPGSEGMEALFVMQKKEPGYDPTGDDWEYLVVDQGGRIEDRGRIELCVRCHAEAPAEHLFGPRGVL